MKKIVSLPLLIFLCVGCFSSDFSAPSVDQTAAIAIETAAFSSGQMIAEKKPVLVKSILEYYMDVNPKNITINDLNHWVNELKIMKINPVYINLILRLADQVGMKVDLNDGKILSIINMNDEYFDIAFKSFINGVAMGAPKCGD